MFKRPLILSFGIFSSQGASSLVYFKDEGEKDPGHRFGISPYEDDSA